MVLQIALDNGFPVIRFIFNNFKSLGPGKGLGVDADIALDAPVTRWVVNVAVISKYMRKLSLFD